MSISVSELCPCFLFTKSEKAQVFGRTSGLLSHEAAPQLDRHQGKREWSSKVAYGLEVSLPLSRLVASVRTITRDGLCVP
ncbi:hypothetical protein CGLO_12108 [Colletotrichum gloeosporioides Cg-14]|uniref:Uncharacterized protein n=1 Tax=Colletotrichum gloeosporioides (strain Cg-14) TaxID=1237896 RepID=T0K9F0_COLGC|nr:hypothetical protein CGLO_12108 [Colletotrichum gloeosporioides Cg-14]